MNIKYFHVNSYLLLLICKAYTKYMIHIWQNCWLMLIQNIIYTSWYEPGHGTVAVFLAGFAINW